MTIESRAAELGLGRSSGAIESVDGCRWQRYESGAALVESRHGTHLVYGAIAARYFRVSGPTGGLGPPLTDEVDTGDGVGRTNEFEHGAILWSPTTGAHEVHGDIARTWRAEGGVTGRLGYPITDELRVDGWCYQYFQHGALRWTRQRGTEHGCPPNRLFGFADTHAHPAAALGFGGLIHGDVEGPPQEALRSCEPTHGVHGLGTDAAGTVVVGGLGLATVLTGGVLTPSAVAALATYPKTVVLSMLEDNLGHRTQGWPNFDGWATWRSRTHQQMHLDWVRRSYDHGQRLMVALSVHSETIATVLHHPTTDMDVALAQVRYVRELAERNASWMAVARSPEEARDIVASDRMAIVLGVEVDGLGGFRDPSAATPDAIGALVDRLWSEGVRYVFPIHLTDNAYGGMALYEHAFVGQSLVQRGRLPEVHENPAVDFRMPLSGSQRGHVNALGLTPAGAELLRRLMDRGMLIDVDHMSWQATHDALSLAEERSYPLVSGHATFADLTPARTTDSHSRRNESRKTADVLERLRKLGSFVGVQPVPHETTDPAGRPLLGVSDCPGSSTSFARALRYARDAMGGRVAIGTDLNGLAGTVCPRFGPGAAHPAGAPEARRGPTFDQRSGVRYRTPAIDARPERFDPPGGFFDGEERDLLRVVVLAESGLPEDRWGFGIFPGPLPAYIRGLRAAAPPADEDERIGYLAKTGGAPTGLPQDKVARLHRLRTVWGHWQQTKGPNPPLSRCVTGDHDFDFNLEGLAHYGLLPDLLVDTANAGLSWDGDLLDLLTSSETIVQTWEKCTGRRPAGYEEANAGVFQDKRTIRRPSPPKVDLQLTDPALPLHVRGIEGAPNVGIMPDGGR